MAREWAYGLTYRSSSARKLALPHWLDHYNERRPHSALGNRPPISDPHAAAGISRSTQTCGIGLLTAQASAAPRRRLIVVPGRIAHQGPASGPLRAGPAAS
jgi:hypothetical protein